MPSHDPTDYRHLLPGDPEAADALWAALGEPPAASSDKADATPVDVDVDAAWARFSARLPAEGVRPVRARTRTRRLAARRWLYAAAAAVLLLIGVNVLSSLGDGVASYENDGATAMTVILDDESRVVLRPGAKLEFEESTHAREANLLGEARFAVASDASRPFSVRARNFELVVVGTVFDVESAAQGAVAVAEGHVRVQGRAEADWTDLYAGEAAYVVGGVVELTPATLNERLNFDGSALAEVAITLEEVFGVPVDYPAALSECAVNGDFRGQGLDQVVETIALIFHAKVRSTKQGPALVGGSCE